MKTKICKKCGRVLELSGVYFYKCSEHKDGFRSQCKECQGHKFNIKKAKEGYRICNSCNEELPMTSEYFYVIKNNKEGLRTICKKCEKEYKKQQQHGNKKYRERKKQYYKEHKEQIKQNRKKNYEQYSKKYIRKYNKEVAKRWKKEHRDKCNASGQRYRTRKRQLVSNLTAEQWKQIKQHFNNRCAYCGQEKPLAQEHFIPLSKDGEYTANNIIPSCKSCNSSKSNKYFKEWYPKYKYYNKKREKTILDFLNYKQDKQQLSFII